MSNRRTETQKEGRHTFKQDTKKNQHLRQEQQPQQYHPKAKGGDDLWPGGGSACQTHYKFEVAPRNPFGAKSTQSDNTVRSNLDSAGNRRPPKAQVARKCSSPMVSEKIEQMRNIMKDACEQFIDPNTTQLYYPTTVIEELEFYLTKLIGRLRSNGASRKPDGEILKITKQIKKLFRNISDGTTNEEENEPDSAEDMLKCIEKSFCQCQQQIEWYKQEKEKVEAEIEKLANDVIDADGGIEKGIHEQINYVRLQMEQQKRKYLESVSMYKQEKSCVETELNTLANAVKCLNEVENVNKQCKLETKEDSEFRVVKVIRQIRRSLEFQNCQTQERLKELESQYNKQVFGELCTLLNMDIELRQKGGSNDNWKLIVKNMKRLVKDKDQFVDQAGKLLNDLSTLINREPFSLTLSGHSDTKRVQVQEPDFQHLLSGLHNVKSCLEEYRESHKEKFVKVEDWNELRECRKRLQKEITELKEEKDELLSSHKEKFVKASTALNELRECRKTLQKEKEELKEEKDLLSNRLKELENRSQNNRQVLGDLCTLLKIDHEPRQKGGSNDNWKVIVENMKRLVKDKDQFVDHAGKLLNDLSTLINREPFSLTLSGHSDTKRVQVQEPDFQHLLSGLHNVKSCLEEYRESHKEKFVKVEDWNELRECRKRLQKEITELKEEKDELLSSHKEKFVKASTALNELTECRKLLQKEIEELKEEKDELLNRLKELDNRSQYNRQVFADLCTLLKIDLEPRQKGGSNDNWKVIVENMERLVKGKDQFVDHAGKLLNDLSTLITREPFSLTLSGHSDTKRVQVQEPDFQHLVSGLHNIKLCFEDYRKSHKEKFVKIEAWNELKECEKTLQKEIEELKEEKDVLLNRLSKMAGANLTDNNPAIADLSDPKRATKLAEQFSELYDNSWTDAFEVLEISDEEECIQYLLNITIESYSICADIANMQHRAIARALHYPTEGLINKTIKNEESNGSDVSLSKLQSRTLSDLRKTSADFSIEDVKSYISAKNENWVRKGELKQFTLSCIELCWFMHLQSPPVYLDATLVSGSTFDTNKYKPYTKSGKEIDFIVWPSLYLHKGGPILCKGVAQVK